MRLALWRSICPLVLTILWFSVAWAEPEAHLPPRLHAALMRLQAQAATQPRAETAHPAKAPSGALSRSLPIIPNWMYVGDQTRSLSGSSVGSAGDVNGDGFNDVFISAPYYTDAYSTAGAVFVFYGSASGVSTSPDWAAYGTSVEGRFGYSVAAAGDVNGDDYGDLLVGAPFHGANEEGRVSVFYGSASGLSTSEGWYAVGSLALDHLGFSVASAGDVNGDLLADIVVGAPNHYDSEQYEGWAFVWHGHLSGLNGGTPGTTSNAAWHAEGGQADAVLGSAVSSAGDVNGDGYSDVAVGVSLYDGTYTDGGQVRVYYGSSSGLGSSPALTLSGDRDGARFGLAVAPAGDVNGDGYSDLLAGSGLYTHEVPNEGLVVLHLGSASGLNAVEAWRAEGETTGTLLGSSMFSAGDVNGDGFADIVVGACGYENGTPGEGAVFLWLGCAEGIQGSTFGTPANAAWHTETGADAAAYGCSVSTAGDVNGDGFSDLIAGAHTYSSGVGMLQNGVTFLFHGASEGLDRLSYWARESDAAGALMGTAGAVVGDLNGDGYDDIALGAPSYSGAFSSEGAVFVWFGASGGMIYGLPNWVATGNQQSCRFGTSVAGPGDLNGDGYDDLLVGAPVYNMGTDVEGAVFVWYGGADFQATSPETAAGADWWAKSDQTGYPRFGEHVSSAGDLNGDGYADIAVSACEYDGTYQSQGAVFVWYGSATGMGSSGTPSNADWSRIGSGSWQCLGLAVALAGDVNGDGYSDLAASETSGTVYVWHGSSSGPRVTGSDWSRAGIAAYGTGLAGVGDVNGDGYGDLAIGSPDETSSETGEGMCEVFPGGAAGLGSSRVWIDWGGQLSASFGYNVSPAGDINADGYADFAVNAPAWTNGQAAEGQVRVYYGAAAGPASLSGGDWVEEGGFDAVRFGWAMGAGDVNGDGLSDLLACSPFFNGDLGSEGKVYVYYGGAGGRDARVAQARTDGTAKIGRFGRSDAADGLQLRMDGMSVFGRVSVKMQWEIKPAGVPMDGTGLNQPGAWTDVSPGSPLLADNVSGLSPATAYHWRVRQILRPSDCPWQTHSRWYTMAWRGGNQFLLRTASTSPTPTPTATPFSTETPTPTPATWFETPQTLAIDSDGHFYCGAFNYTSSTFINTIDTTGPATLSFDMTEDDWIGVYLYDYTSTAWSYGLYILRDRL